MKGKPQQKVVQHSCLQLRTFCSQKFANNSMSPPTGKPLGMALACCVLQQSLNCASQHLLLVSVKQEWYLFYVPMYLYLHTSVAFMKAIILLVSREK